MNNKLKFLIILFSLIALSGCNNSKATLISNIKKYKISLPDSLIKDSGGFYPGIGSGLQFSHKIGHKLEFYGMSDRGPNFPYNNNANQLISFDPEYSPKIVKIIVNERNHTSEVISYMDIKYNNSPITGLNINNSVNDESLYNNKLEKLDAKFGLDTESIAILKNGDFVVGDEYYPSINIINHKTGEIKKRLTPGKGLPEIFKYKNFNRGFEALTVAPNGKIYAILEGVLNIDAQTLKQAKLIRMLEIDLENSLTKTYAYPFDYDQYKNSKKAKIGDMDAIDNETFILVEQGPIKDGSYRNIIYKINIKDATDISTIKLDNNKELEHLTLDELKDINFVSKKLLINPRDYGWSDNKLEGVTIIDSKTIAITNDNDFAITGYDVDEGACCIQNKISNCKKLLAKVNKDNQKTNLWTIHFQKDF